MIGCTSNGPVIDRHVSSSTLDKCRHLLVIVFAPLAFVVSGTALNLSTEFSGCINEQKSESPMSGIKECLVMQGFYPAPPRISRFDASPEEGNRTGKEMR
jgi:hypothetical protein